MIRIRITGTGSCLPENIVTNKDLEKMVNTSDEWIRERTGICERHISSGEGVAQLAKKACEEALVMAQKSADEVDLIIAATCSDELRLPCCACRVQEGIGADRAAAFDLNAACSGFLFALDTAAAYIQSGIYRNALVVGAEVLSELVDWSDRSTCVLFGDGAGAVFMESADSETSDTDINTDMNIDINGIDINGQKIVCSKENKSDIIKNTASSGIISMVQRADGKRGMALSCGYQRADSNDENDDNDENDTRVIKPYIQMDGQEVYRFATRSVPECIGIALEKASLSVEDIDLFVLHQANYRIIEAVARRLKADISKFPVNLMRVGNMSSATIPVLLDEINREGRLKRGDKIVLSGFGAGLTYGACVLVW